MSDINQSLQLLLQLSQRQF